ncbi:hypothetical protein B296_00057441 [Ensete ventricosum]|uniref:GDSL esterase/lipase n=1 Tax=Ensete ventricosum TaxID=4639 RepID=A0A426XR01_ENSVE|nr:hypothetical protein B296_00057441 [Ensete ventricosum]
MRGPPFPLHLLHLLPVAAALAFAGAEAAKVPAIYVFGDSTADVGNNNYLPGSNAKANFPHNGVDFPFSRPTGRFSNGYNGIDFLVRKEIEVYSLTLKTVPVRKKMIAFLLILLSVILSRQSIVANSAALYAFGDSTTDVGNNNFLPKANFLPYGIDYPGGTPTGRFTNGFNSVDYVAQAMGLATSPPPFLSGSSGVQMTKGVNFASGGAGILDSTVKIRT